MKIPIPPSLPPTCDLRTRPHPRGAALMMGTSRNSSRRTASVLSTVACSLKIESAEYMQHGILHVPQHRWPKRLPGAQHLRALTNTFAPPGGTRECSGAGHRLCARLVRHIDCAESPPRLAGNGSQRLRVRHNTLYSLGSCTSTHYLDSWMLLQRSWREPHASPVLPGRTGHSPRSFLATTTWL